MADENSNEGTSSSQETGGSYDSAVNVNIKTLDSQIFTFRVKKNMQVRAFKEKIAGEIHVPMEQQRLIFRGKVLKDDHLLSEYKLEDGDTLHLVARQPAQSQAPRETDGNTDNRGNDSTTGASRNRIGQVSHSVVLGTFNIGDQGDGLVPDLNRLIGAVLNSVGYGNLAATGGAGNPSSTATTNASSLGQQGGEVEGTGGSANGRGQTTNQVHPGQNTLPTFPFQSLHQAFQMPPARAVAAHSQSLVIPDSLTTISEYINRMEQYIHRIVLSYPLDGYQSSSPPTNAGNPSTRDDSSSSLRGLPTPEALGAVTRRAHQLLTGPFAVTLIRIVGQLERAGAATDPALRSQTQVETMQVGLAMQHLGSLLLELGRTILTLRMGQSHAEAVVNAGPAVYISPSGPNPIMVQPQPFPTSSLFSTLSPLQTGAGVVGSLGTGDIPRNLNIHIHAGSSGAPGISPMGPITTGEVGDRAGENQNPVEAGVNVTVPSNVRDTGSMRALPVRTVIAAIPGRPSSDAAGHVLSVHYPLHTRSQQTAPDHSSSAQATSPMVADGIESNLASFAQQQPLQSDPLPTGFAQVQIHVRNLDGNSRAESSSGSIFPAAIEPPVLPGCVQASAPQGSTTSSANESQPDSGQFRNTGDVAGSFSTEQAVSTSSFKELTNCPSIEAVSSKTDIHPCENSSNSLASRNALGSDQSHEPSNSGKTVPLGLGSGGLQPFPSKRRTRQVKMEGKEAEMTSTPSLNQNAQSIATGQRILQSLVSPGSNISQTEANGPPIQLPPAIGQIIDGMSSGGQFGNGQIDVASMMSQVLRSPALNNILEGVSEQSGGFSTSGMRNILEQITQSPSMRNTLNQMAEQVEGQDLGNMLSGFGNGQGGFDFSRMVQQMMPVVSQALSRGSTRPDLYSGVEEPDPLSDEPRQLDRDNLPDDLTSQIDLQQTVQSIECHDPPGIVFRSVVENASRVYDEGSTSDLVEEICNDDNLANEFMEMLHRDIRRRVDPESSEKS